MRLCRVLLPAAVAVVGAAGATASAQPPGTVVRIEVADATDTRVGVAFAIHEATREGARTVYFVTAARLFDVHVGHRARLFLAGGPVNVDHPDISVPGENRSDAAVLRIRTDDRRVTAVPIVFTRPSAGQVFVIAMPGANGAQVISTGRLGAVTTRALRGDRPLTDVVDCLGAPVSHEHGAFALVSACDRDAPPTFVPFSAVRSFLGRQVPGLMERPSSSPQFVVTDREMTVPTPDVPAGETREGVVTIPLAFNAGEAALSATAQVVRRTSLHLADVRILQVADRSVTLRFSLGGDPPPTGTAPWPVGQALVVLHVNFVSRIEP